MNKSRHSALRRFQLVDMLNSGVSVSELSKEHNIAVSTLYKWKARYSGLTLVEMQKLLALESENHRLKHLLAQERAENKALAAAVKYSNSDEPGHRRA